MFNRHFLYRSTNLIISCTLLFSCGCINLDRITDLKDTRILAIRTEPAEILYSPLHLLSPTQRPPFPLPNLDVAVDVFAFDLRATEANMVFELCPEGAGDASCRLYDPENDGRFKALSETSQQALLPHLKAKAYSASRDEEDAYQALPFQRLKTTITPDFIDMQTPKDDQGNPLFSFQQILPRLVSEVKVFGLSDDAENPDVASERSYKRLPLSLNLAEALSISGNVEQLEQAVGFTLCKEPYEAFIEGLTDCLKTRAPNQNPVMKGFIFSDSEDEMPRDIDVVSSPLINPYATIRVNPGDTLHITPILTPESIEEYQSVSFDIATKKLTLMNRLEDLAVHWYSSGGNVSRNYTALQFTERLGMTWKTATERKTGDRDTLIAVLRDQRGGVDVAQIMVEYR